LGPALGSTVVSLVVVALSPAVLLAGELVNRHYLGGRITHPGRLSAWEPCQGRRMGRLVRPFLANPVWIALTAPARWLLGRVRPLAGRGRRGNGNGPPPAGVREPRRPRPDQPAGAIAMPEPR
jgi:hypothetical protein